MPYLSYSDLRSDIQKLEQIYKHYHPYQLSFLVGHRDNIKRLHESLNRYDPIEARNKGYDSIEDVMKTIRFQFKLMMKKKGYGSMEKFVNYLNKTSSNQDVFARTCGLILQKHEWRAGNLLAQGYEKVAPGFAGIHKDHDAKISRKAKETEDLVKRFEEAVKFKPKK